MIDFYPKPDETEKLFVHKEKLRFAMICRVLGKTIQGEDILRIRSFDLTTSRPNWYDTNRSEFEKEYREV